MNGVLSANNLMITAEISENSVRDKLHTIVEKAENGDLEAIKVLEEINRILKQV
ncbi:hypothetical protein [Bacillus wiedmannii]|uniref:hypothetical protein n=1 Tax=Bacillus wiedmannii TaxID=1890302 RepID=UPI00166FEC25|nr:hypothetical protein [Bacillus wiedmannii]